ELSGSHARQNRLGQSTISFTGPDDVAYRVDTSDPSVPKLMVANGVNVFNPALYSATTPATPDDRARERDLSGALNLTRPYVAAGRTSALQVGVKLRGANKSQTANDQTFAISDMPLSAITKSFSNPDFYSGNYQLGPLPDLNAMLT